MLGPLLDTVLVCTITGLIVIISGAYLVKDLNGIVLTLEAFRRLFFGFGDQLLLIMVFVFGIFNPLHLFVLWRKNVLAFLPKTNGGNYYNYFYIGSIIFSALVTVEVVIGIIDLSFALMCIPNMIAILYLSKGVKKEMQERNWIA